MDDGDSDGDLTGTDDVRRPASGADGDGVGPGLGSGPSSVRIAEGTEPRAILGGGLVVCLATAGALLGTVHIFAPAPAIALAAVIGGAVGGRGDDPLAETMTSIVGGSLLGGGVALLVVDRLPDATRAGLNERALGVLAIACGLAIVAPALAIGVSSGIDWVRDWREDATPDFMQE